MRNPTNTSERGATLVEMAVVLPLLLILLFGTVELGLAFRTYLDGSNAAKAGARMVALMGNDPIADCEALKEITISLQTAEGLSNLDRVEIYKADTNGNQIPSLTNTYQYVGGDPATCTNWSQAVNWAPTSRQVLVGSQPLDIAGVKVVLDHAWVTGLPPFVGAFEVDESTLTRLEPEAFE